MFTSADVSFFENKSFFGLKLPYDQTTFDLPRAVVESLDFPSEKPLQVYVRKRKGNIDQTIKDSVPVLPSGTSPSLLGNIPNTVDIPIALRKAKRTCTHHPIAKFVSSYKLNSSFRAFTSSLDSTFIPHNVQEALKHPGWQAAMKDEMQALWQNHTWQLVSLPPGGKTVGCRWVFTVKYNPDGTIERLKARLVAKGYTQQYGVDYTETFSPVAKLTSIRVLISIASSCSWPLHQLDVKNAFLNGDLTEVVYMQQPPGFERKGENLVCSLKKSLYGLKQSPRAWFEKFGKVVCSYGFSRSKADHSLFTKKGNRGIVVLLVYVDDIIVTGSDSQGIAEIKQQLSQAFHTKDLGPLRYFLGIEVARNKDDIFLSQRKYILDILTETGMLGCRPSDTPMDPNIKLSAFTTDPPFTNPGQYRKLVGKLIYLSVTRPDIAYAVSRVSQFMQAPTITHWEAAIRILRYLKKAPGQGLLFKPGDSLTLRGYSDADWAGSVDDRRSTSGYFVFLGGNLVSWKSKKQSVVALSSAEAEYRAIGHLVSEILWLRSLLRDLDIHISSPTPLHCDNQSAIYITENPVFHERTKHIEITCHFVRDEWVKKVISFSHVRSTEQLADILTKALPPKLFHTFMGKLGFDNIYAPA